MISTAAVAAGGAIGLLVWSIGEALGTHYQRRALAQADGGLEVGRRAGRLRRLIERWRGPEAPGDLAALIDAAGGAGGYSAGDLMKIKLALAAGALVVALGSAPVINPARQWPLMIIVAPAIGFLFPDVVLRRRAARRRRSIERELPAVVDRVLLAVRAGLPLSRALSGAAAHGRGLLSAELRLANTQIELGLSRGAALERLSRSCPVPAVIALVAAIRRADRHGVALEPLLRALASGARTDNHRRIAEQAQGAAPKIQLIVALLLVPAAICCVAAGMIAGLGGS
ncbi:MAG: type II secretion system F family protein [Actinomycetes bacterium]